MASTPWLAVLIATAVILVGAVGFAMTGEPRIEVASAAPEDSMAVWPVAVPSDPEELRQLAQGVTIGDPYAKITIMEFADYSCPHCRAFEEQLRPRIEETYVKSGKAKFVFHDYVLGGFPNSFLAARAARCAGDQEKYMEYHDALFAHQPAWSTSRTPPVALFLQYANVLGLTVETFETCLRGDKYADVVSANRELAVQLNLGATPAVVISSGGSSVPRPVDHPDVWAGITQVVDSILEAAAKPPAAPVRRARPAPARSHHH